MELKFLCRAGILGMDAPALGGFSAGLEKKRHARHTDFKFPEKILWNSDKRFAGAW